MAKVNQDLFRNLSLSYEERAIEHQKSLSLFLELKSQRKQVRKLNARSQSALKDSVSK